MGVKGMHPKKTDRPFILGVGLGRTGTSSLQIAFQDVLKLGKCYHMREIIKPGHAGNKHKLQWAQAMSHPEKVDWTELFQEYAATLDFPACWCYKEILKHHRDAKVIL